MSSKKAIGSAGLLAALLFASLPVGYSCSSSVDSRRKPVRSVVDLHIGESARVELSNGATVSVKLLRIDDTRDNLSGAIRRASAGVEIDGQEAVIDAAFYNLPINLGKVKIDCPITKAFYDNSASDPWGLEADARLRLWPADSPLLAPNTFVYPVGQRWLASGTQMDNEPTFVDGGESAYRKKVYYHWGLDFGGAEGMVPIISATDGLVVSAGEDSLPGYDDTPISPRYDVIYVVDDLGWYYRYSHLHSFDPSVKPGGKVKKGQQIGLLGKEGGSGGWSHLHFDITCRQPSGKWGNEQAYAYAWEAYVNQYQPPLLAVARPHQVALTGETVSIDGLKSRSLIGRDLTFEWTFSDGRSAAGPVQTRTYSRAGTYSEILKVSDSAGNVDYDFATVQVSDRNHPERILPSIHGVYYPTFAIHPGDPVTFKVRSFNAYAGTDTWDFGDGSRPVEVKSHAKSSTEFLKTAGLNPDVNSDSHDPEGYAATVHRFAAPGTYIVKVERTSEYGHKAAAHLRVEVGE